MVRWPDLAEWRGPTVNVGGPMHEQRGVVIHIAEGSFEGTIAWQRNPEAKVSSHFIVAKDGRIAQMVNTDITAWTQRAGNGSWISVENEGHTPHALTDAQIEANARILAKAHQVYGVPLELAQDPWDRGLGHHCMGGKSWGHLDCPGPAIIAQKPAILARAQGLLGAVPQGDDDMGVNDELRPGLSVRNALASVYDRTDQLKGGQVTILLAEMAGLRAAVATLAATHTSGIDPNNLGTIIQGAVRSALGHALQAGGDALDEPAQPAAG